MSNKLSKNVLFVESFVPYDFSRTIGQLAIKVIYTDGDTQTLTTKSTKENVYASYDFENETEFYDFIKFLEDSKLNK